MDKIRTETVRKCGLNGTLCTRTFRGRIAVYENNKRLYSIMSDIERISRGDALRDAQQMASDLLLEANIN